MQINRYTLSGIVFALNGWDGNGNFLRTFPEGGWKGDATAGIKIRADRHDDHDQAICNALSNAICKDGQTTVLADIPFNGKKITGLGAPTLPTDAVNKGYADSVKTFTTGTEISGADINGRVTFTSPTGANGLAFTGADLSWIARLATAAGPGTPPVPPATINRLCLNDKADATGTDVIECREDGSIKAGAINAASFTTTGAINAATLTTTGTVTVTGDVVASGLVAGANVQTGGVFGSTSGVIFLRPNGVGNDAGRMHIDGGGNVLVTGNITTGNQINSNSSSTGNAYANNIQLTGQGYKPGGGSWASVSDSRIKDVHGSYEHGLAELLQVKPVRYAYKASPDTEYIGIVAQDIEDFLPETVTQVEGEIDGQQVTDLRQFDGGPLVYALINAVKELSAKLDAANARIEALEAA
jgi:hypothetical protein